VARMVFSHPTVRDCDSDGNPLCKSAYRNLTQLSYCDVYDGPTSEKSPYASHCRYLDRVTLQNGASRQSSIFIPTAVEVITDEAHCEPNDENGYSCENTYQPEAGSDCLQNGRWLCQKRGGSDKQFYYVADVLNYRVQFSSTYERDTIRGTSLQHQGLIGVCKRIEGMSHDRQTWTEKQRMLAKYRCSESELELEKIPCAQNVPCASMRAFDVLEETGISVAGRSMKHGVVGNRSKKDKGTDQKRNNFMSVGSSKHSSRLGTRGNQGRSLETDSQPGQEHANLADEVFNKKPKHDDGGLDGIEGLDEYSNHWGDVFTVKRLLTLAGVDFDNDFNMDGWTTRQSGTVIEVTAVYNNLYAFASAFGYRPVSYHYTVSQLPLPYVSRVVNTEEQPADFPKHRRHEVQYGLLIHFKVGGTFGFFNLVYMLVMMTTALALTGTAGVLTDLVGLYVHPRSANFFHLKYEVSPDFSDAWKCAKCGFLNHLADETCRGVPQFCHAAEVGYCGEPRPPDVEQ